MKISLTHFKAEGLRCPDVHIELGSKGSVSPVNLIMMPNGTGKTTIITLIEHALTGKEFTPKQIRQLKTQDYEIDEGFFHLGVAVAKNAAENPSNIIFEINFNFIDEEFTYTTSMLPDGIREGWAPPQVLRPFLNSYCVDVFAFKGDKAEKLTNDKGDDADQSVKAFFGFNWIDEATRKLEDDFKNRLNSNVKTSAGAERKVASLTSDLNKWSERKDFLIRHVKFLRERIGAVEEKKSKLDSDVKEIEKKRMNVAVNMTAAEGVVSAATIELNSSANHLMDAIRNPLYVSKHFRSGLHTLKEGLDSMQLPGTSRVFFQELTEHSDECICGRPMDAESKNKILLKAEAFLGDDAISVVNGIKESIDINYEKALGIDGQDKTPFDLFRESQNKLNDAQAEERIAIRNFKNSASEDEAKKLEELEALKKTLLELERNLEKTVSKRSHFYDPKQSKKAGPEMCENLPAAEAIVEMIEQELSETAEISAELDAKRKLTRILLEASAKASKEIKLSLKERSNISLEKILPAGTNVRLGSIDQHITLTSQNDVEKAGGSGGETAAVAYSFVSSILDEANVAFPLIVDHPVTALMGTARLMLTDVISSVSHQFIGFIIDTEVDAFVEPLIEKNPNSKLFTFFRDLPGNSGYKDFLPADESTVQRTKNGVLCTDTDYFFRFKENFKASPGGV